jgi:AraC-like DNA-binding protein
MEARMSPQGNTRQTDSTQIQDLHAAMARIIARHTEGLEDCTTPVPNLLFFRREAPTRPCACLVEPSIVLVVQGVKQMLMGEEAYAYDTGRFLITSLDLPASSQVVEANLDKPCLGMTLKLDLRTMAEMIAQGCLPPPDNRSTDRGMGLGTMTPALLEPCKRLLDLIEEPNAIPMLAPLIQREIHYRLLLSDQATRLWQIASVGSQSHWVAKAVDWLKVNYAQPLRVEELAARARMSPSSLHHHFRQLTAMSPLQYQKWLRLNEARRLMLNENYDAANAAFHVGYESPSQFGREYNRLFGAPPKRDIDGLRRKAENLGQAPGAASA